MKPPAVNTPSSGPAPASFLSNTPNESEKVMKKKQIKLKKNNLPPSEVQEVQDEPPPPAARSENSLETIQNLVKLSETLRPRSETDEDISKNFEELEETRKNLPASSVTGSETSDNTIQNLENQNQSSDQAQGPGIQSSAVQEVQERNQSLDIVVPSFEHMNIDENLGKFRI